MGGPGYSRGYAALILNGKLEHIHRCIRPVIPCEPEHNPCANCADNHGHRPAHWIRYVDSLSLSCDFGVWDASGYGLDGAVFVVFNEGKNPGGLLFHAIIRKRRKARVESLNLLLWNLYKKGHQFATIITSGKM